MQAISADRLIATGTALLVKAGVPDAGLDARLLLQHCTGWSRSALILNGAHTVGQELADRYRQLVSQRCSRVPLHYLTGSREFWSMEFLVTPAVLIPRPETEFLLESALAACPRTPACRALDMCTGSGVIAVVLAKELGCEVDAVDISPAALRVAALNVAAHKVEDLVRLIGSDLFAALVPGPSYDLILSNPPYIANEQLEHLEPEVARAEPRLALSGGASGLEVIERIVDEAERYLKPQGLLFLEIGADQEAGVTRLLTAPQRCYDECSVLKDWAGRPRVLKARFGGRSFR